MTKSEKVFVDFVFERARIYYRKEIQKLPYPWTSNEILQKYRFCNVCREHDRVSKFLISSWYHPHYNENGKLITAVAIARVLNQIPILKAIGFPEFEGDSVSEKWIRKLVKTLETFKQKGETIKNCAYYVNCRGYGIIKFIHEVLVPSCKQVTLEHTFQKTWEKYQTIRSISSFMAGQFCKDLTYSTDYAKSWPDRNTFAAPGPGPIQGIEFLFGKKLSGSKREKLDTFCRLVMEARELLEYHGFRERFPEIAIKMDLMDYQNCLCEFSKYWKIFNGMKFRGRLYRYGE